MAKQTFNGCSYSNIWVRPENWRSLTSKKSLDLKWFVQCKFYDPLFKEKYKKGFPYKKKLNHLSTLEERKDAIRLYLEEIPRLFEEKGFNPITKQYMVKAPVLEETELHGDLPIIEAFNRAFKKLKGSKKHLEQINYAINRVEKAVIHLRYREIKIKDFKRSELKQILDYIELPDSYFNKFKSYLSSLFIELIEYECCETNITRDIRRRKVEKKEREVLDVDSFNKVMKHLEENYYTFYRYAMIFLYSGARSTELMRLTKNQVNLKKREFKVKILKGGTKYATKVIFDGAIPFWEELLNEAADNKQYLFSRFLRPGEKPINEKQITRRWNSHVKKKLGITADFYAFKHYFLDAFDTNTAMQIADHTSSKTTSVYQLTKEKQKIEKLKEMKIVI